MNPLVHELLKLRWVCLGHLSYLKVDSEKKTICLEESHQANVNRGLLHRSIKKAKILGILTPVLAQSVIDNQVDVQLSAII